MALQNGFTNQLKTEILTQFFSMREDLYVGLFLSTGQPDEDLIELVIGTGIGDYTRKQIHFGVPNGNMVANNQPITWNTASYDWTHDNYAITHIGVFDNDGSEIDTTGPNSNMYNGLLVCLPLSKKETVKTGNTFVLNTDTVRLQLV